MAHVHADRVADTTTTTGTGSIALNNSPATGYRSFGSLMVVSDTCYYTIAHQTAAEWEVGLGTYSATNTLARTTVLSSSNANAAVTFSSGTKDVFITNPAVRDTAISYGLYEHSKTINSSYTIAADKNAISVGPLTIASGKAITVSSGARWLVL